MMFTAIHSYMTKIYSVIFAKLPILLSRANIFTDLNSEPGRVFFYVILNLMNRERVLRSTLQIWAILFWDIPIARSSAMRLRLG